MEIDKKNIMLSASVLVMALLQLAVSYNGGCPPDVPCFGPGQIQIIGITFSYIINITLFFPLLASLAIGVIISLISHLITKGTFEQLVNIFIKIFSITAIILMALACVSVLGTVY